MHRRRGVQWGQKWATYDTLFKLSKTAYNTYVTLNSIKSIDDVPRVVEQQLRSTLTSELFAYAGIADGWRKDAVHSYLRSKGFTNHVANVADLDTFGEVAHHMNAHGGGHPPSSIVDHDLLATPDETPNSSIGGIVGGIAGGLIGGVFSQQVYKAISAIGSHYIPKVDEPPKPRKRKSTGTIDDSKDMVPTGPTTSADGQFWTTPVDAPVVAHTANKPITRKKKQKKKTVTFH